LLKCLNDINNNIFYLIENKITLLNTTVINKLTLEENKTWETKEDSSRLLFLMFELL